MNIRLWHTGLTQDLRSGLCRLVFSAVSEVNHSNHSFSNCTYPLCFRLFPSRSGGQCVMFAGRSLHNSLIYSTYFYVVLSKLTDVYSMMGVWW